MNKKNSSVSGFTLVEVLIVVVVIVILASIAIVGYNSIYKSAQEEKRLADMTVMQQGLERFYSNNGEYPGSDSGDLSEVSWATYSDARINTESTLGDLKEIIPAIDENFGDPSRSTDIYFSTYPSYSDRTYFYIGGISHGPSYSLSGSYVRDIPLNGGLVQRCRIGYSIQNTTGNEKRTLAYIIGYYSESKNQYVFFSGRQGTKRTIEATSTSDKPCEVLPS